MMKCPVCQQPAFNRFKASMSISAMRCRKCQAIVVRDMSFGRGLVAMSPMLACFIPEILLPSQDRWTGLHTPVLLLAFAASLALSLAMVRLRRITDRERVLLTLPE